MAAESDRAAGAFGAGETGHDRRLRRLCDLFGSAEGELAERAKASAMRVGTTRRGPIADRVWREGVRGLSDTLFQAVYGQESGSSPNMGRLDPVAAYGVVRARSHRRREVTPDLWLGHLRHYERAYVGLVADSDLDEETRRVCRDFVECVFDRLEEGYRGEWDVMARRETRL